jgi:hypothetical protein
MRRRTHLGVLGEDAATSHHCRSVQQREDVSQAIGRLIEVTVESGPATCCGGVTRAAYEPGVPVLRLRV